MRILSGVTDQYIYFVAVDSTDYVSRETGLSSFTVYRSRNGGVAAAMTTPTINETDTTNMPGVYELLLDEDMTIDAGDDSQEMVFHITHAGMAPVTRTIELYRAKVTAGETIGVSSGAVSNVTLVATTTTNTDMRGTDSAALASALATAQTDLDTLTGADGVTLATSQPNYAPATASALTTHDGKLDTVDTVVDAIKVVTDALPNSGALTSLAQADTMEGFFQIALRSDAAIATDRAAILTALNADEGSGAGDYGNTTESMEAMRDRGDAAWITATGFSTHSAADVRTEMDSNSTQLAAIVADTNELQTDWVNGGRLDLIIDAILVDTGTTIPGVLGTPAGADLATDIAANQTDLDAILADLADGTVVVGTINDGALGAAAIVDIFSTQTLTEAYATDGSAATPAQLLYQIWSVLAEMSYSGTTGTAKKLDGSTTAMTFTLNSATSPTSVTRAS